MIICNRCNHQNPDGATSCELCGADLVPVPPPIPAEDDLELVSLDGNDDGALPSPPPSRPAPAPRATPAGTPGPSGLAKLLQDALGAGDSASVPGPASRPAPVTSTSSGLPSGPAKQNLGNLFEPPPSEAAFSSTSALGIPRTSSLDISQSFSMDESELECWSCGGENPPGMYYCVHCGANLKQQDDSQASIDISQEHVHCPSCTHVNTNNNRFCSNCGFQLGGSTDQHVSIDGGDTPSSDRVPPQWDIRLVSINEDGTDGVEVPLHFLRTVIGRSGDTRFPTDAFLSPKHAGLTIEHGELFIEDLYSLNGTFVKIRNEVVLSPGDLFLMGRQVLRFEKFEQTITPKARSSDGTRYMGSPPPGGQYKLLQIGIGDIIQNVYCIPESGVVLGREKGEIIFPRDKFMSGRHAQIYKREDGRYCLVDLTSSNGTWIKIWEKTPLQNDDFIFLGQQLFRVEVRH